MPEADTDLPGSGMLIRTSSRYSDGTPTPGPQVCVALELAGDAERAVTLARELERRGYLPPAEPLSRAEFDAAVAGRDDAYTRVMWEAMGLGVPLGMAVRRAGLSEGARRNVRRAMKAHGWLAREIE